MFERNEGFLHQNLLDKRKKLKPKYKSNGLVKTADLKTTFSKGDKTNWIFILHKITENVNDTIPCYKIDRLPERCNEALLKKTQLAVKKTIVL